MIRKMLVAILLLMPRRVRLIFESHHYRRLLSSFDLDREPDLKAALRLIQPGDTVIDIGASVGLWTLHFIKRVGPSGRVIAFEPVPETFAILQKLVSESAGASANVQLHNYALSDVRDRMAMQMPRDARGVRNHYCATLTPGGDIPVTVEKLDNICGPASALVHFVKIDTEGHELRVVHGGMETLRRHRPILCIEISTDPDDPQSDGAQILLLLGELGYRCYVQRNGELFARKPNETTVNYFFVPDSRQIGAPVH